MPLSPLDQLGVDGALPPHFWLCAYTHWAVLFIHSQLSRTSHHLIIIELHKFTLAAPPWRACLIRERLFVSLVLHTQSERSQNLARRSEEHKNVPKI